MDAQIAPDTARILAERGELIRMCAARVIDEHARGLRNDPAAPNWAKGEALKHRPLQGALSDGVARPHVLTEST